MKEREVGNEENSSRRNCRGGLDVLSEREKYRGSEDLCVYLCVYLCVFLSNGPHPFTAAHSLRVSHMREH